MKVCDKTCTFFFFPIINKYFLMAKRSLLSKCLSYIDIEYTVYGKVVLCYDVRCERNICCAIIWLYIYIYIVQVRLG